MKVSTVTDDLLPVMWGARQNTSVAHSHYITAIDARVGTRRGPRGIRIDDLRRSSRPQIAVDIDCNNRLLTRHKIDGSGQFLKVSER